MTPAPNLAHRRATDQEQARWSEHARVINTCRWCKTAYRAGSGAAWVCEHWHEGL
jgi:hypothetical protein